jgi:adenine-specific DNA-methyltransferase
MDKLKMHSMNKIDENIRIIRKLFPNCITERKYDNGKLKSVIDFDILRQELSSEIVEGREERYQFTWPDKKKSILLANSPIAKTLRPCKEESVDFDNTENLYIEGDNLDVLKLLQETYLSKIKMIYIDPPYNTGNDFVYEDDFAQSSDEYLDNSGQFDDEGNRLVQNTESNGRFHTDWLNMMYPRLKLAKDLLSDDGVIFISIDDNELENLKNICNEIYGEQNFLGVITWSKKRKGSFLSKGIISLTEYLIVYSKNRIKNKGIFGGKADASESQPIIKRTNKISVLSIPESAIYTKLSDGIFPKGTYGDEINPVELIDDVIVEGGMIVNSFRIMAPFVWSQKLFDNQLARGAKFVVNTINFQIRVFKIYDDSDFKGFPSYINGVEIKGTNEDAYEELEKLFKIKKLFDYTKPKNYIKALVEGVCHFDKKAIILDFFSGSATTAHAVMQLNAEDGGNRKHIMVQLPELTNEKSPAYKAGYDNICEIGKERIRRAGKEIKENIEKENMQVKLGEEPKEAPDIGFRVLKLGSTNMKDVYYNPADYNPTLFDEVTDNIKDDRSPMDLLFQVMLQMDVLLSSKIEEIEIGGKKVFSVMDNYLIACFDTGITTEIIEAIARKQPYYTVFRDSCMADDSTMASFEQIFETYSKDTIRKVL